MKILSSIAIFAFLALTCCCGNKNAMTEKPVDLVSNPPTKSPNGEPVAPPAETESPKVAFTRQWPDDSDWDDEQIIEVKSDAEVMQIMDIALMREAQADGTLFANVHAVVTVDSEESLKRGIEFFRRIGSEVTTFEFQFTKPLEGGGGYHITAASIWPYRLILSGTGDNPVSLNNYIFDLVADVVQINNLEWSNSDAEYSRLKIKAKKYVEITNCVFEKNSYGYERSPAADALIVLTASKTPGDELLLSMRDVSFDQNKRRSLLRIENDEQVAAMRFSRTHITNNQLTHFGIHAAAKETVDFDDCTMTGNTIAPAIVRGLSKGRISIKNSRLSGKIYRFPPGYEYKKEKPLPLVLENNEIAEGTILE